MKKQVIIILIFLFSCLLFINCKKSFTPNLNQTDLNVLVVEGYIDGGDTISFKLSRTRKIYPGDSAISKTELHARLLVEDDHHNTYPLVESGNGIYKSSNILSFNPAYQYRLHFFTSDSKEYVSDYVAYKVSQPIDSIGWDLKNDGLQLYVNTHDPSSNTKFYRWDYAETWEFNSQYLSNIRYDTITKTIINRTEQVYTCWKTQNATQILLGNTTTLSNDVVNKAPINFFPYHDVRLDILYSILVKQYPLDLPAYNFWQGLKTTTENTGSIFDAQPTAVTGNIHGVTSPSDRIIGYVGAGSTYNKRVFIDVHSLPSDWLQVPFCSDTTWVVPNPLSRITLPELVNMVFGPPFSMQPITPIYTGISITGYVGAPAPCVDCTVVGTNRKPSFWP